MIGRKFESWINFFFLNFFKKKKKQLHKYNVSFNLFVHIFFINSSRDQWWQSNEMTRYIKQFVILLAHVIFVFQKR